MEALVAVRFPGGQRPSIEGRRCAPPLERAGPSCRSRAPHADPNHRASRAASNVRFASSAFGEGVPTETTGFGDA